MGRIDKIIVIKSEDNILNNEIPTNKAKKFIRKKLLVCILVVTIMMGTVSMANEYFELNIDNALSDYLGIDKNNESLNGASVYIDKSDTYNNLKLNVKQTLGDKHSIYILIDVEAPNNITIPENASFNEMDINLKEVSSAGWSISDLEDKEQNNNKRSYIISYRTEGKLNGNDMVLDFKDFGYYSDKDDEFITLVEGNWNISWKLDYTDVSKEIIVNRFVKTKNSKYFITKINISPISVSANLIGRNNNGDFRIKEVDLKDGTSYVDTDFISSVASSSFLRAFTNVEFRKVINVNQIESITIDDEVIKLKN